MSSAHQGSAKKITLQLANGNTYDLPLKYAKESVNLMNLVEALGLLDNDEDVSNTASIPDMPDYVTRQTLDIFVAYAKHDELDRQKKLEEQKRNPPKVIRKWPDEPEEERQLRLEKEREDMLNKLSRKTLIETLVTAKFLVYDDFKKTASSVVAKRFLDGKSPSQIAEALGIETDYTPEELQEVDAETAWMQ